MEDGVVRESQQNLANRTQQGRAIAAGQVRAPD